MLLIVGLFNFVNIYTVMMLRRAREFGVKKVYGAGKWKIFSQIWVENFFTATTAMLLVWALIELTSGLLESLFSIPSKSNAGFDWLLSILILVFFPLLTAIHPAVKYFRTSPITSLRSVSVGGHSVVSRTVFLFSQYVITFCLIVVSSFFVKQLYFMLNADLGYRTKDVMQCQFLSYSSEERHNADKFQKAEQTCRLIQDRLFSSPLFEKYATGDYPCIMEANFPVKKDDGEYQQAAPLFVSPEYMQLFGFQLLEGRMWNDSIDEFAQYRMIINESAKKLFEITDITQERLQPEHRLWISSGEGMDTNPPYEIAGVIKDFKTNHLSKGNIPLIILYHSSWLFDPVIVSIVPGKRAEAVAFLQQLYDECVGEGNFQYSFLEDEISAMYNEDRRTTRIYVTFAVIAIVISCLGLFGLSLFDIRQRYREIALRKVNGATAGEIFPLLLKKYAYILGGAFAVAVPLSYLAIHTYLESFAHRASVSWYLFAMAAGITALVSYVTLAWQVNKAVKINPAEVIKGE
jgi:ABC-type antimicrobial peptide transport system permease subunit